MEINCCFLLMLFLSRRAFLLESQLNLAPLVVNCAWRGTIKASSEAERESMGFSPPLRGQFVATVSHVLCLEVLILAPRRAAFLDSHVPAFPPSGSSAFAN